METDWSAKNKNAKTLHYGFINDESIVQYEFETKGNITFNRTQSGQKEIFTKNFNFNEIGIGGLDNEFSKIFRRIFTSRLYPESVLKKLGINHVRGMLL